MKGGIKDRIDDCIPIYLKVAVLCIAMIYPQTLSAVSDVEMTGFKIVQETESGRWEIQAGKAYYDGQGDVILQDVSARMSNNGEERIRVVSDKGRYDSQGLVLHLEGSVSVASGWGSKLETSKLEWNGLNATMKADGGVQLMRNGLTIMGKSVRYTVNSGTATVDGSVWTTWDEGSSLR